MEEEKNMRKKSLMRDKRGQVLGLPMYLIVIMIVAVAIIAAVIFMIPRGSQTMNAQVTIGSITSDGTADSAGEFEFSDFDVVIKVTTNDDRRDPIVGAIVRLSGGHTVAEATTDDNGIATITISDAKLDANVNEAYMKMTVKASGYEDFEDDDAVLLYRG